jgi:predicted transcriptional regulator
MREATHEYIEREERRAAFRWDVLAAWNEYRQTGLHATADEVDAWLATWGTDGEAPAPECCNRPS